MNEITCPNCQKTFSLDDAGFEAILSQVRNAEFDEELHRRMAEAETNKQNAVKLAEAETANKMAAEAEKLRTELAEVKAKMTNSETEKQLAVRTAVEKAEKERVKKLTLDFNERQEEEEFQEQFPGVRMN